MLHYSPIFGDIWTAVKSNHKTKENQNDEKVPTKMFLSAPFFFLGYPPTSPITQKRVNAETARPPRRGTRSKPLHCDVSQHEGT